MTSQAVSRFYLALLLAIAVVVAAFTVSRGAVPQSVFGMDCAISYDAGWRDYCGLRPHADFYSSLGPWIYLYVGTGYHLFGVNIHVIAYMNAIMFCLLLGSTWYLLRDRLSPFWLFCIALLIAACFAAPYSMRYHRWNATYVCMYNRHGGAFLMLYSALLFSPIVAKVPELRWKITSAVLGVLLSTVLFLKVTLFGFAVPLLVAAYFIEARKWLNIKWLSVAFVVVTVLFLAYIRFDIVAMISDLTITAKAKSRYFEAFMPDVRKTTEEVIWLSSFCLSMFALGIFSLYKKPESKLEWKDVASEFVIAFLLVLVSAAFTFSNAIYSVIEDYPILVLMTALICVRITARDGEDIAWSDRNIYYKAMMVFSAMFVVSYVASTTYYLVGYETKPARVATFTTPALRDLVFDRFYNTYTSVQITEEGLALLKKNDAADKKFVVFEFASLFHFALKTAPYKGTPFVDYCVNITEESYPSREKFLGDAEFIIEAKPPGLSVNTVKALNLCYKDYLQQNYKKIDESEHWILLKHL